MKLGRTILKYIINFKDGNTQSEICKIIDCSYNYISILTTLFEEEGFLTRRKDRKDDRIQKLYLTTKGKEFKYAAIQLNNFIEITQFRGKTE